MTQGFAAGNKDQFEKAFFKFKSLADAGDPYAGWLVGDYYQWGKGVPQNHPKAENWYRESASLGYRKSK